MGRDHEDISLTVGFDSVAIRGEHWRAWVFPEISYCADGICAAARIARMAGQNGLSEITDDMPRYAVVRGSVSGDRSEMAGLLARIKSTRLLSISCLDGIRLGFGDGEPLAPAVEAEAKIMVTAEGDTELGAPARHRFGTAAVRECMATGRAGPRSLACPSVAADLAPSCPSRATDVKGYCLGAAALWPG